MSVLAKGSCQCGAHRFEAEEPETVTRCNCSICSKRGALSAYYKPDAVVLNVQRDALVAYLWGDRLMTFFHCAVCSCPVYSEHGDLEFEGRTYPARLTLNARLFDDLDLSIIPVLDVDNRGDG